MVSIQVGGNIYFYPRSPCGERLSSKTEEIARASFLSTLSLRRATVHYDNYNLHCVISIHALLAESDAPPYNLMIQHKNFYPRSPCGERRIKMELNRTAINFYPRSPCGERPTDAVNGCNPDFISIHALLAESDDTSSLMQCQAKFLSTLSLRRATQKKKSTRQDKHFYPRSPCGERHQA
mgnify:CR=1 FL=1